MAEFSVAIRTYNGAAYLPRLLEAVRSQQSIEGIDWEVVVVDNNSTDDTLAILQRYQAGWPSTFPLTIHKEPRQGAVYARQRAIQVAQGDWIGFLDNDTVPTADWVAQAITFGKDNPQAGAYSGQIHGVFETPPPDNFGRIAQYLPIVERKHSICFSSGLYNRKHVLPPGAGLVIRKQAWVEHVPKALVLQGPVGSGLAAKGEDIEALMYLKKAGWEIWFNPAMEIEHYIPKERLERAYLLRFFHGIGLGRYYTRTIGYPHWLKPLVSGIYMANDLRKLMAHWLKYHHDLTTDTVLASEFQLYISSFMSPIYRLRELADWET
ncbi:MAG: hormogonium polysaccharide biosynthesis glycosyltransferase HpsE [Cyanobacteria bacterium]|nr:hormogonium polysaccharide biosynthesis glycosyltransferase HpsE [Cyanobacteriota bacterium]MDA0865080.1 hormogonium polysaccharide biosynthesis glycosyltransferase HpsE [Cyanobacteriota bacterium]